MKDNPNRDTALEETTFLESQLDTSRDDLAVRIGKPVAGNDVKGESDAGSARRRIQLLTGTRGKLSDEVDHEMLSRLRIASLLLFSGNLVFLIRGLLWLPPDGAMPLNGAVFWAHVTMTVVTGLVGLRASIGWAMQRSGKKCESSDSKCKFMSTARLTGWHLRISELLVFGGSAVFSCCSVSQ